MVFTQTQTPDTPIAGIDYAFTVPAGKVWKIKSFSCRLTTDVTVLNRTVRLRIQDGTLHGGSNYDAWRSEDVVTQGASLIVTYCWAAGVSSMGNPTLVTSLYRNGGGLPDITVAGGWAIETLTDNLQGADQFDRIQICYEEYIA